MASQSLMNDPVVDRTVDAVVVGSGALVFLADIESYALIFSLVMGGCYYGIKAWIALNEYRRK